MELALCHSSGAYNFEGASRFLENLCMPPLIGMYVHIVSQSLSTPLSLSLIYTQTLSFAGLAIGNGLCDPEHMLKYGDYLYQIGLIDLNARAVFHEKESLGIKYIQEKKWNEAFDVSLKNKS